MFSQLNRVAHELLESIQKVVGHPLWFFGNFIFFVAWMILQLFLPHPLDRPWDFFPGTIWMMTCLGYWIENAMKAQQNILQQAQAKQDAQMQEQINRIEAMAIQNQQVLKTLITIQKAQDERSLLIHKTIEALDIAVDKLAEFIEDKECDK